MHGNVSVFVAAVEAEFDEVGVVGEGVARFAMDGPLVGFRSRGEDGVDFGVGGWRAVDGGGLGEQILESIGHSSRLFGGG